MRSIIEHVAIGPRHPVMGANRRASGGGDCGSGSNVLKVRRSSSVVRLLLEGPVDDQIDRRVGDTGRVRTRVLTAYDAYPGASLGSAIGVRRDVERNVWRDVDSDRWTLFDR